MVDGVTTAHSKGRIPNYGGLEPQSCLRDQPRPRMRAHDTDRHVSSGCSSLRGCKRHGRTLACLIQPPCQKLRIAHGIS
jgi:hypothetical protein